MDTPIFDNQAQRGVGGVRAEIGEALTVEDFSIDDVVPVASSVPTNTEFDLTVQYSSDGGFGDVYDTNHPDFCTVGFINRPAALLYVRVNSAVTRRTDPQCWATENTNTIAPTLTAVSSSAEGEQTVTVELVGANSKNVYDTREIGINVTDTADDPPDQPDDTDDDVTIPGGGGQNGGQSGGGSVLDPFLPDIGAGESAAIGAAVGGLGILFLLVFLLSQSE